MSGTTPILGITEVAAAQNQKEVTINDAFVALENATQAQLAVSLAATNSVTLTQLQYTGAAVFLCSGQTAAATLTVPLTPRVFLVRNASASYAITVGGATGTTGAVPPLNAAVVQCDGTNCTVLAYSATTTPARNRGVLVAQFVLGNIVTNGTFYFAFKTPYAGTVTSLDSISGTGTFTVEVEINGTPVTNLSAVAVTATETNTAATASNTFAAGATISGIISAAAGSPTNAVLSLNVTWS